MSPLEKYVRWMIILTLFTALGYYQFFADNGASIDKRGAVNLGMWVGWLTCMIFTPLEKDIRHRRQLRREQEWE